jgi:O-succinylbenzoic acid--CoA ligase
MERAELIQVARQTGASEERDGCVFLLNPADKAAVRTHDATLERRDDLSASGVLAELGWLCISTGGTSGGTPRFARHDERTMSAAVRGFCSFFDVERVNAIDVLPPYHVSGFMARVRCAMTKGQHLAADWRSVSTGHFPKLDENVGPWMISLVPTQLQRLLTLPDAREWLRQFKVIFLGGGPTWPELAEHAASAGLSLALTYGMTETAAMIAAIKPEDFIAGERDWAEFLPHAKGRLTADGTIRIEGDSVFRGYHPEQNASRIFDTSDLGQLDGRGRLHVLGRRDSVIITGGKKVQPEEVEAALQATGQFTEVAVIGLRDTTWGEIVVACFPAGSMKAPDRFAIEQRLETKLAPYKRPKRYVAISDWPRTTNGKLNRAELAQRALLSGNSANAP